MGQMIEKWQELPRDTPLFSRLYTSVGTLVDPCLALVLVISFWACLCFGVPSLFFATHDSECVTTEVEQFTLKTWLIVDAYMRLGLALFLLACSVVAACYQSIKQILISVVIARLVVFVLFLYFWTFVGNKLYWGVLKPMGVCTGSASVYVAAELIITSVMLSIPFVIIRVLAR
jgi:hypothetical protein